MLRRSLLIYALLFEAAFAISQTCIWSNGDVAEGYVPCNASATQGTCCLEGEACLDTGLCYGSIGLVYRGACLNLWDSSACLTYCDDISATWANLYPCTGGNGSLGPSYWWCGGSDAVTCSTTTGTVLKITPGDAYTILSASSSTSTTSSSGTLSSTSNPVQPTTSSASSAPSCSDDNNKVTVVGASVGVPLGVFAVAMLGLFLNERRRRKSMERDLAVVPVELAFDSKMESPHKTPSYTLHERHELADRPNEIGSSN